MTRHDVVSHEEWLRASQEHLVKEKAFARQRDEIAAARRSLPWEPVTKDYSFDGAGGRRSLVDLFDGCSQLIVYHFMFDPAWDAGCPHCSFWADHFDRAPVHLKARDVSMVAVSRAPYTQIAAYQQRMGWTFRWYSSFDSDFNYDFNASFTPESVADGTAFFNFGTTDAGLEDREGMSVFAREESEVFHTYSTYARGIDMANSAYMLLDLTPKGRDEPKGNTQFWVRRHDEY